MRKTSTDTLLKTSKNKDTEKTRELTTDELNHVSGGKGKIYGSQVERDEHLWGSELVLRRMGALS